MYKDGCDKGIMNLAEFRKYAEEVAGEIRTRDPFWQKCYPCEHKGVCCIRVEICALKDEIDEIRELLEKDEERRKLVADNLKRGKRCIFYSSQADECLVFPARPMACRLNPFGLLAPAGKGGKVEVLTTRCQNCRITFGIEEQEILAKDGRFVTTTEGTYFNLQGIYEEHGINTEGSQFLHVYFKELLREKKPGLVATIRGWLNGNKL